MHLNIPWLMLNHSRLRALLSSRLNLMEAFLGFLTSCYTYHDNSTNNQKTTTNNSNVYPCCIFNSNFCLFLYSTIVTWFRLCDHAIPLKLPISSWLATIINIEINWSMDTHTSTALSFTLAYCYAIFLILSRKNKYEAKK